MSVYYKFKSAKDYNSVGIEGHFVSVGELKEKIFEKKQLGRGTDFDLVVTNAQTNEEYLDEGMPIPKNTSVIISRVPGPPRKTIKTAVSVVETNSSDDVGAVKGSSSSSSFGEEFEWDEFGTDIYGIPETGKQVQVSKEEEESKIKALIENSALDWQQQHQPAAACDGYNRRGRGMGGRGFGFGFEKKTPPQGYTCHRCKVAGHFIQHCPTNGDPEFDVRRVRPPTGIPKSMLMETPDGSYALPSGAVAVWKPNNEKEIEGVPSSSTRPHLQIPPELHCPLCKQVMKDAALASKCCFASFCDRCIRDHVISKAMCVCGATKILADDLLPNKTLRETINRILGSNNSGSNSAAGSANQQVQDMESRKVPSPTQSAAAAASKGQERDETTTAEEENKISNLPLPQEKAGRSSSVEVPDVSAGKEEEENKKKKKKLHVPPPPPGAAQMHSQADQNYMMPFAPCAFSPPYWNGGIQPDGYMPPMPYMGYGIGLPYDPFGGPGCMLPFGPPAMGFGPPTKSRDEFEAHKAAAAADRKRKRSEMDGEYGREGSSSSRSSRGGGYVVSSRSTPPPPPSDDHHRHERRSRDVELPRPSSKKKSEHKSLLQDETQKHHHHHGRLSNSHPIRSSSKCLLSH